LYLDPGAVVVEDMKDTAVASAVVSIEIAIKILPVRSSSISLHTVSFIREKSWQNKRM
jgi:hypothetical protein